MLTLVGLLVSIFSTQSTNDIIGYGDRQTYRRTDKSNACPLPYTVGGINCKNSARRAAMLKTSVPE